MRQHISKMVTCNEKLSDTLDVLAMAYEKEESKWKKKNEGLSTANQKLREENNKLKLNKK